MHGAAAANAVGVVDFRRIYSSKTSSDAQVNAIRHHCCILCACYAAILVGRITVLARPSVRPSVSYEFLAQKQKKTYKNENDASAFWAGLTLCQFSAQLSKVKFSALKMAHIVFIYSWRITRVGQLHCSVHCTLNTVQPPHAARGGPKSAVLFGKKCGGSHIFFSVKNINK